MAEKNFIADKATLDSLNNKVGTSADVSGSTTSDSLFSKINYLIENSGGTIDYSTTLGEILTAAQNAHTIDYTTTLTSINSILSSLFLDGIEIKQTGTIQTASGTSTQTYEAIKNICFISNDGTGDLTVQIGDNSLTLRSGEVLNDVDCYSSNVIINGTGEAPYRALFIK